MTTFEEVVAAERGHVWIDRHEDGFRFLVKRGGASVCAYLGVPDSHPLAGHNYENLPLNCHGGLTYGAPGEDKYFPAGWYWYGWDYAHLGDFSTYDLTYGGMHDDDVRWTPEMVDSDSQPARREFKHLMNLAEAIVRNVRATPSVQRDAPPPKEK